MIKKFALYILLLIVCDSSKAQNKFDAYDFQSVDSFIKTVKYEKDIIKLSQDLTKPYTESIYKVRAIFRWVTENIAYDYKFINKGKEIKKPDCESVVDCSQRIEEWKEKYIKTVLQKKKGVCSGYAELFKRLCDLSNIKCEVVEGYVKNKSYQVGNSLSVNHAWNAVMIDSVWYYLDATWAAGGCAEDDETGKLTKYIKEYKNYYWLTPYPKLVRNHYPANGKWIEKPAFVKQVFFNKPYYYSTGILENIDNEKPDSGVLQLKRGDTIHFSFNYKKTINQLQINSNNFRNPPLWYKDEKTKKIITDTLAIKRQVYIPFKKSGDTYTFDYIVNENSLYYIELLFDYNKAMRYRIKIIE
jgi:Transglutaminase-like superfamily